MIFILIIVAIIFAVHYKRKKIEEKKWEMLTYSPDNEKPYKRGWAEIQQEREISLFDQYVRSRWPKNFLSYEVVGSALNANFIAPHKIIVHHTDGTFHEEVIVVSASRKAEEDDEYGIVYKFSVWGEDDCSSSQKKREDVPKSKEKSPKEIAKEWLDKNLSWINDKLSDGYLIIRYGIDEKECPPELKEELFNAINDLNLFQIQYEEGGIGVYPEADI